MSPEISIKNVTSNKSYLVLWMRPRGAGASSPRKSYNYHTAAEPVLPYNGTGENGGQDALPVPSFRQGRRTAKIQPKLSSSEVVIIGRVRNLTTPLTT